MRRRPRPVQHARSASIWATITRLHRGLLSALTAPLRRSGTYLVTLALALLTLSLLINFGGQVLQSTRLEAHRVSLATEVARLEAENLALQSAVEYAESNANVERVAREQLGYTREGDIVILPQFPVVVPTPTTVPPTVVSRPVRPRNWQQWWNAFFPADSH